MGRKKAKGEYNDFLDDTRHQNNNDIHTTLQTASTLTRTISPPTSTQPSQHRNNTPKLKKPPLTHFLSLPITAPQLPTALTKLRQDLETHTPVPPAAVRPPGSLHLTLGVMALSPTQLSEATRHLETLDLALLLRGITTQTRAALAQDSAAVGENAGAVAHFSEASEAVEAAEGALKVSLYGLVPMQSAASTSVLYAQPKDVGGRLERFVESVKGGFEEGGWVVRDGRAVRLHVTLVNTVYAKGRRGRGGAGKDGEIGEIGEIGEGEGADGGKARRRDSKSWMRFDATGLIEAYKDFAWADDVLIDRVQICKMGARKILNEETGEIVDEKYEVVAEKRI
ncbi:AKAP7 2'5' RNA ligase-like domain-containing protein [Boeremia exigua]|uniref:AKAP7 2'5' RNA ligase-like domain-containing protein n=1 Tax=Boeremia exigua TaxID=749465 RepID=UPI001E8DAF54|nr:AKAP7 2'5' RNA ligase-like domain-containing protein [Boeremia exigua]KAH6618923.1 AKAP7 2'5' RNA ligase-like domain-containing protein [Boeremia exigua]